MKTKEDRINEYKRIITLQFSNSNMYLDPLVNNYKVIEESFQNLIKLIPRLDEIGYFNKPSCIRFRGSNEGELFDHSLEVTKVLLRLTDDLNLRWYRPVSPLIVGLFHDLYKCDNYVVDRLSNKYIFNHNVIIPGHGDKSVIMLQQLLRLTNEEIACIHWHMGAHKTDTKMWNYYEQGIRKYPNILYTYMADMIASKIKGV